MGAVTALVVLGAAVSAQEAPRTSWGDPDLQGIWVGSTLTPLERPSEYQERESLTEQEVTALETEALAEEKRQRNRPAERAPQGGDVDYRPDGSLGADSFWFDEGTTWEPSGRTSLISDATRFTRPWTVRFPLSTDQAGRGVAVGPLFEYACHEGNYAIVNALRGARVQDTPSAAR